MALLSEPDFRTRNIVTPDGLTLAHRIFDCPETAKGVAFVAHSQAQHTMSLRKTLEGLSAKGWNVHGMDLRGHGHSSGPRAPLGHMDVGEGWERLVGDLQLGLKNAFNDVPWEKRLVVAPNISAPLVLEVLKTWPDLAKWIVFATPPSNQPAMLKLARSFMKARLLIHAADKPDELTLHQLYSFLGARLSDRKRLIDVMSSDRSITDALLDDDYAWPIPTTGYFHEMFRGIEQAWTWPEYASVKEGTSMLILYGGDDPMTANGRFVAPMREELQAMGFSDVAAHRVEDGRAGLIIEEDRFGISTLIDSWIEGGVAQEPYSEDLDAGDVSSSVLRKLGLDEPESELSADALVDLCYNAIDDESRWVEMLYRVTYAISADERLDEQHLEAILIALMPHWDRSYKLNRQIMQTAAIGAVLENVISRFRIGMAVVSPDLEVSYANPLFLEAFARLSGEVVELGDDLSAVTRSLQTMASSDFLSRCQSGDGEALFMVDGEAVGYHFRPQALRQTALQRGGAAGTLILRHADDEEGGESVRKIELLQFAYALTSKEAEVALGLLDGLSPDGIAQKCGVSINTTRTHLKRIYEKVGVQGQNELTARLLKGPIGLIANG